MSKHLIDNCVSPYSTYISNCYPPSTAQPGHVHYDSGTQTLKVFDGSAWHDLNISSVSLSWEAEQAIDKMIEITNNPNLSEFADKYPLVAEALGQLEVALKLSQNND